MNNKPGLTFRELRQRREEAPLPKAPPPAPEISPVSRLFQTREQPPRRHTGRRPPARTAFKVPVKVPATPAPKIPPAAVTPPPPPPPPPAPVADRPPAAQPAAQPIPATPVAPIASPTPAARPRLDFWSLADSALARWPSILLLTSVWMLGALLLSWRYYQTRATPAAVTQTHAGKTVVADELVLGAAAESDLTDVTLKSRPLANRVTPTPAQPGQRWWRITGWTVVGLLAGLALSLPLTLASEFLDDRLKTAADVARVTGLPILGSMGNLLRMLPTERATEGFRLWKSLQNRLAEVNAGALICGVTSSGTLEGKTTLITLLAQTATQNGYRVKIIQVRPPRPGPQPTETDSDDSLTRIDDPAPGVTGSARVNRASCSLDRMPALERALQQLRQVPQLLVLVDLPSATVPESVVAAEKLPNLVWVADCARVHASSTRTQVATLRQAQCRLVGAVLNHEPRTPLRDRFPRWSSPS